MTNLLKTQNISYSKSSVFKRILHLAVVILLVVITAAIQNDAASANIHSPQGALDIAEITPGKYSFAEKKAKAVSHAEIAVSSIKGIADLMKQATETAAMLPSESRPQADSNPKPLSDIDIAIKVASALPADAKISKPVKPAPKNKNAEKPKPAVAAKPAEKKPTQAAKPLLAGKMSVAGEIGPSGLQWPVEGAIYSTFNSPRGKKRRHGAIDIVTKRGTPISAALDGVVSVAANGGRAFSGYGKVVIIKHDNGMHTLYSHCDTILVKMGQMVKRGEFIGTVGRTGRATTDHLHFEVRLAGAKKDPLKFLPDRPDMVKALNYNSPKKKKRN
ncbi:MAG: peptidoglycan DD-metalloendopeptidase family protein, partial [Synergistaceae bacterium]|jgi:murein DD-endopeptidase MepM/ murein hydrolase activator NlpD|nr:peptidoglycan DD-metalloendopeptidase family protein [Synergistaceae bacterium]